jgi:hypothetical protein
LHWIGKRLVWVGQNVFWDLCMDGDIPATSSSGFAL